MSYSILINEGQIAGRLKELAGEIEAALPEGGDVIVLALLNGALWFASDLLRLLPDRYILKTLKISSYGSGKTSSGVVTVHEPLDGFSGKTVLVLDDVIDAGLTLHTICRDLLHNGAEKVFTAVAVNKRGCRQVDFEPDFSAFTAGHEFLIGYGMDHGEKFRNLPFIAVLDD